MGFLAGGPGAAGTTTVDRVAAETAAVDIAVAVPDAVDTGVVGVAALLETLLALHFSGWVSPTVFFAGPALGLPKAGLLKAGLVKACVLKAGVLKALTVFRPGELAEAGAGIGIGIAALSLCAACAEASCGAS